MDDYLIGLKRKKDQAGGRYRRWGRRERRNGCLGRCVCEALEGRMLLSVGGGGSGKPAEKKEPLPEVITPLLSILRQGEVQKNKVAAGKEDKAPALKCVDIKVPVKEETHEKEGHGAAVVIDKHKPTEGGHTGAVTVTPAVTPSEGGSVPPVVKPPVTVSVTPTVTSSEGAAVTPIVTASVTPKVTTTEGASVTPTETLTTETTGTTTPTGGTITLSTNNNTAVDDAPSNLVVGGVTNTQATLTWADNSSVETMYVIELSRDKGATFEAVAATAPDTTTYTLDGLTVGTAYVVRVRGINGTESIGVTEAVAFATTTLVPTLKPGTGWTGPTAQPPGVGVSTTQGYDAKVIGRWDVVPYQNFGGDFTVGVMAFHLNGVERVDFAVNGGAWVSTYEPTLNALTNVWEYNATLQASDFADGKVEVRAIAYPKTAGQPRVLDSLYLNANAGGTRNGAAVYVDAVWGNNVTGDGTAANPFKNLWAATQALTAQSLGAANGGDNATIYLMPGKYEWYRPTSVDTAQTVDGWLTVMPAPGVTREQVSIINPTGSKDNGGGLATRLVHLENVTLQAGLYTSATITPMLWLDHVAISGLGANDGNQYTPNWAWTGGIYVTDSTATNVYDGFVGCTLVRNCLVDRMSNDAFSDSLMVINSEAKNQLGDVVEHSDIYQQRSDGADNIILYGVKAIEGNQVQGIFSRSTGTSNVAIIDCDILEQGYPAQNQWITQTSHFLMRYNTLVGVPFSLVWHDEVYGNIGYAGSQNATIDHNVFQWMLVDAPYSVVSAETKIDSNHYLDIWPDYVSEAGDVVGADDVGTGVTTGAVVPTDRGAYGTGKPPAGL